MARVYLGLGSNIDRDRNIRSGLDTLANHFGELALSPVYEAPAVGFAGDCFYNLVVHIHCQQRVGELATLLRKIEVDHGRPPNVAKFSSRTLDIDILTYDDLVGVFDNVVLPRDEIFRHAYVLKPLADLAPAEIEPLTGESYGSLWQNFRSDPTALKAVDFAWCGCIEG